MTARTCFIIAGIFFLLGATIQALAVAPPLVVFSSNSCGSCIQLHQYLNQRGIQYKECNIDEDQGCNERFKLFGAPGTPLIVVNGTPILGFDKTELDRVLK